ncbi:MAG: InlB B-repeat-containing protein, partial [Bacteroidales bacterium]|nr:InlB B-repeat-containing protein [Bacteroidales bacterium]
MKKVLLCLMVVAISCLQTFAAEDENTLLFDGEGEGSQTNICTWWYTDDDTQAMVTAAETDEDGNLMPSEGGNPGNAMSVTYSTVVTGGASDPSYANWGCMIGFPLSPKTTAEEVIPVDITGATSLQFDYKTSKAGVVVVQIQLSNGRQYEYPTKLAASTSWTEKKIVDFADFVYTDWSNGGTETLWSEDAAANAKLAAQISFAFKSSETAQTGTFSVDNIELVGKKLPACGEEIEPTCEQHTVTFVADGVTFLIEKECDGEEIEQPADPTKTGYAFNGWLNEAEVAVPFPYIVNGSATLTATFIKSTNSTDSTVIADCEDGNAIKLLTYWYSYQAGESTIDPLTSEKNPFVMTDGGYDGTGYAAVATGELVNPAAPDYEYTAIGFPFKTDESDYDLTGATGISFYHKGDAINFSVMLSTVTPDGGYDYSYSVQAHSTWTLVTAAFPGATIDADGELAQPVGIAEAEIKEWDPSKVTKLQWQIKDGTARTYEFGIDEVTVLGKALDLDVLSANLQSSNNLPCFGETITLSLDKAYQGSETEFIWARRPAGSTNLFVDFDTTAAAEVSTIISENTEYRLQVGAEIYLLTVGLNNYGGPMLPDTTIFVCGGEIVGGAEGLTGTRLWETPDWTHQWKWAWSVYSIDGHTVPQPSSDVADKVLKFEVDKTALPDTLYFYAFDGETSTSCYIVQKIILKERPALNVTIDLTVAAEVCLDETDKIVLSAKLTPEEAINSIDKYIWKEIGRSPNYEIGETLKSEIDLTNPVITYQVDRLNLDHAYIFTTGYTAIFKVVAEDACGNTQEATSQDVKISDKYAIDLDYSGDETEICLDDISEDKKSDIQALVTLQAMITPTAAVNHIKEYIWTVRDEDENIVKVGTTTNSQFDLFYSDLKDQAGKTLSFSVNSYDDICITKESEKGQATAPRSMSFYAEATVTFNNGSAVYETITVCEGENVSAPTAPSKDGFEFKGWAETDGGTTPIVFPISAADGLQYYAIFEAIEYAIIWQNYDGSTLAEDIHLYGETPEYSGEIPTKPSTAEYDYNFSGWSPEIVAVT